ncbi:DUF222 domain-containing protein [Leifsonia poae]|uniref:HNH endonuclease signature motif containing protein n=1 Tax=Leifsonia poae TaxID=110933 RepID=UPI003D677DC8
MSTTSEPAAVLQDALTALATPASLGRDALLHALTSLGDVQAVLDAAKVRVVGELVARSCLAGPDNPVRRAGHASAAALVAERWQISMPIARQYCLVGDAVRPRLSLAGEVLPALLPLLGQALEGLRAGRRRVGMEQAAIIVRELARAAPGCSAAALEFGERVLVEAAPDLSVAEVRALAAQVRDRLDEDGILPREERQRRRRSLTISTTVDGMTRLNWELDPESAGYVVSAIDSLVGAELRKVRFRRPDDEAGDDADAPETRSVAQIRSDAATDVFRHLASCTSSEGADSGTPVTVIVRVSLADLRSGAGVAEIDGIRTPISVGTARRMAADATIIPMVLGGESEVLDLGRGRRLFSRAQKLALAERDGGCAWAGCPHPPSYTEGHHVRWWNAHSGATDLENGILLCRSHHHRIHDDGWQIDVRDQVPYFVPPAHVDPYRRPRAGGRVRFPRTAESGVRVA